MMNFTKYQGTGNDFILIDQYNYAVEHFDEPKVKAMCERRFGIGADGLIILRKHEQLDFEMVYYNSDGRTSSMCGNGGRCIVHFAHSLGIIKNKCQFMAIDGKHTAEIESGIVKLKMNDVSQLETADHALIMDTGSPHYVIQSQNEINIEEFKAYAQRVRYNDRFKSEGINVNAYRKLSGDEIEGITYERGVEGITYSCGTGVCAMAIAFAESEKLNGEQEIKVNSIGGLLTVSFNAQDGSYENLNLIGPAVRLYDGEWNN